MEEQILAAEKALYLAYITAFGAGHSTVTRFKSFGLNSQRVRQFRAMINATKEEAAVAAKYSAAQPQTEIQVKPSAPLVPPGPKKETAPVSPIKLPQQPQTDQGESGEVVAGGDFKNLFDLIGADIAQNLSNTQIAAKYELSDIVDYAEKWGVNLEKDWSEKQVIAAIKKQKPEA